MVFDHSGAEVARHQLEHTQIMPRPGWVEHNPIEIWERTCAVIQTVLNSTNLRAIDLAALGLTNQRETTLVWNRRTGRPYANAIVWQDTRTDRIAAALGRAGRGEVIRHRAGLPPAVPNPSRTMLMNLQTLDWDDELLGFFAVPRQMLPRVLPSSTPEPYG